MRAFVKVCGALFGALFVSHVLRVFDEGTHLLREPFFVLMTIAAAALCAWAVWLLRR